MTIKRRFQRKYRRPRLKPTPNTDPWRAVITTNGPNSGRGGLLGGDTTRRTAWWVLRLECGHQVERVVKYLPAESARVGGTQSRSITDVRPAPKRVRCEMCA